MSFQHLSLGSFILSFAIITSILTISVIIIFVLICLLKRRIFVEEDRSRERVPNGPGLNRSAIAALPTFSYKPENTDEEFECPVCLCLVPKNVVIKVLPNCSHMFDEECIGKWLESHKTCPVCRTMAEPVAQPVAKPVASNQETRIEIRS